jgi:two-component system, sensor histidine kinase PdtaS
VSQLLQVPPHLDENDRSLLARVEQALPLLADIARADVLLYVPRDAGKAVIAAEAKPHTVPAIYPDPVAGRVVGRAEEPTVLRTISSGSSVQRVNRVLVHGHPTVEDVYPIWNDQKVIGALSIEIGLLEANRQKRKSPVFRRAVRQLRRMVLRGQLEGAQNVSPLGEHDGPVVVDDKGTVVYISSIAENLYRKLGYSHSLLGANVANLRTDEVVYFKAVESGACVEQEILEGDLTWVKKGVPLVARHESSWIRQITPFYDEMDGAIIVIHDLTTERRREQELRIKNAMIKEIHHRVKNNLQTIAALLRLQARRSGSPEVTEMLKESINRIMSIAVIHEFLALDGSSIVNLRDVAQRIVAEVARSVTDPDKRIRFSVECEDIYLPTQQASSCALIVNELLQNAFEHGYEGRSEGQVQVYLRQVGDQNQIEVIDDGQGLRPESAPGQEASLGLQIVRALVRDDLRGQFELRNREGKGARALVNFPRSVAPLHPPNAQN